MTWSPHLLIWISACFAGIALFIGLAMAYSLVQSALKSKGDVRMKFERGKTRFELDAKERSSSVEFIPQHPDEGEGKDRARSFVVESDRKTPVTAHHAAALISASPAEKPSKAI